MIQDLAHYIEKIKEHEEQRTSFEERQLYWLEYYNKNQNADPETSFDLNKF